MKSKEDDVNEGLMAFLVVLAFLSIICLMLYYLDNLEAKKSFKSKLQNFTKGAMLKCPGSYIGDVDYYLVSKDTNWSIYDEKYLKRDSFLLNVKYCKETE